MLPRVARAKTSLRTPRKAKTVDDQPIVPSVVGKKASIPANQNTKYIKLKPKRKIPDNPNVKKIEDLKTDCDKIIKLSMDFIESNSATPEISQAILVPLAKFQNTLPQYYESTHHFFETFAKIQSFTQTAQIVSTQSIRTPVLNFTKAWERFVVAFNKMKNGDNIPHAHLVLSKFDQIKITLDYIDKANNERKFPSSFVTNCTRSLKLLCDNISSKVVDLFKQPIFPFFDEDVYSSYKATVKSFVRLINEAFMNELPQSGLSAIDLNRHKQSIVLDCSDIIKSMRTSFDYPNAIKEIGDLLESIEKQRQYIDEQFNFPNNVVHPLAENQSLTQSESDNKLVDEEEKIFEETKTENESETNNVIERNLPNSPIDESPYPRKTKPFDEKIMKSIFGKIGADYRPEETIDEMLTIIEMNLDGLIERNSVVNDQNNLYAKRIDKLTNDLNEAKTINEDKFNIMSVDAQAKLENEQKLTKELEELQKKEREMHQQIFQLQAKLSKASKNDDTLYLREAMMRIAKKGSEYFKIDFDQQNFVGKMDSKDGELINFILKFFDTPCKECAINNERLLKIKKEMNEIAESENKEIEENIEIIKEKFKDWEEMQNILSNEVSNLIDSLEMILRSNGKINEPFELTSQNATVGKIQKKIQNLTEELEKLNETFDSFLGDTCLLFNRDVPLNRNQRMDLIQEMINQYQNRIEKLRQKKKEKKEKIERMKVKIDVITEYVGPYFSTNKTKVLVSEIKEGYDPIQQKIDTVMKISEDIKSAAKGICARILGMVKLDFSPEMPIDMLITTMNNICDSLQDDREKILMERKQAVDDMKMMRNCLNFCDLHLRSHVSYLPVDVDVLTNEQIMKRVQDMIIKIDNMEYSGRYIQKSQVESVIAEAKKFHLVQSSSNVINTLSSIMNRYITLEKTSRAAAQIYLACSGFDFSKIAELHHAAKNVDRAVLDPTIMNCIDQLITVVDASSTQYVRSALGLSN